MANKVLRIFRQNFLSNFARCESLLTSCPRIFCVYLRLDSNYKNRKKLHMFLFIGDVTSVQCITSVLNNTKAGRLLLSSASVEFSCGSLGWSARLVRPSGKSPIPANVGYPDLPSFGSQPFHCQLQKTQKSWFSSQISSQFWDQKSNRKLHKNWRFGQKRPKIENLDKKDQKLKIRRKKLKIEKNLKNSEKFK